MHEEAYNEYQKALQLNPDYPDVHNNLGVLYTKINRSDLAMEEFKRAIKSKQMYSDAHNNLGILYAYTGELDLAIESFKNAISSRPDHPDAYANLGTAYLKRVCTMRRYNNFLKQFHMTTNT